MRSNAPIASIPGERALGIMGTKNADLPAFAFPVVAWAPQVATGDEGDDGTRKFGNPHELTRTYMPKVETRLGWTFVDSRGRCWEAVSAKVVGRVEPWPMSLAPNFLYDPAYRLAFEFVERPPMSFVDIRNRLLAVIDANPEHYRWGYGAERRKELLAAETLEEVTKPGWLKSLEAGSPEPLWAQWLMWEGRSSRLEFLAGVAVFLVAWGVILLIAPTTLAVAPMVMVSVAFGLSAIVRRMHDLKRSGWWIAAWLLWGFICASIYAVFRDTGGPLVAGWLWWISNLCIFGCLALWPGRRSLTVMGLHRPGGVSAMRRVAAAVRNRTPDAAVLAAPVRIDRLVEADVRTVVGGDDVAGLLRRQRGLELLGLAVF